MRRVILRSFQSPGDVLMLTAAIRDLHAAHPGSFQTDVRTSADALWEHNRHLTSLKEHEPGVETLDMHYPLIHESNQRPYHFLHGYVQYLEQQFGLRIPIRLFKGDVHLSDEEKTTFPAAAQQAGIPEKFWIIMAGGKHDFTAKWWNPENYQAVVDHFQGRIQFVQCGEEGHWHPPLQNVINLVGKTSLREFVRLMYHAEGVVCPVTFAMHLAAAVESKSGHPRNRACVVVAGGREPAHWEAYPHHQFISTNGALSCCEQGGCWKSRCQLVGDGDPKDHREVCENPVDLNDKLRIPRCMDMITAQDVIRRIEFYYDGGALQYQNGKPISVSHNGNGKIETPKSSEKISVSFYHGLGDAAHFAHLIPLYTKRGFEVEVECTPDKRILFEAAGVTTIEQGAKNEHLWGYPSGSTYEGQGRFWQGSKTGHNISEPPFPDIGAKDALWQEYCDVEIDIERHLPPQAMQTATRWLSGLPQPVVLLHSKGNTAQKRKSLPDAIASPFYEFMLDRFEGSILLLDWDQRVPRLPSYRVRHIDDLGACSTEILLALMTQADLMVGVDSGPLHTARFTKTRTVGLWMPGHYPATYTVPRRQQLNIVLSEGTHQWNRYKRIPWNIVEHPGRTFDPEILAVFCCQMLAEPRYLSTANIAADVQLQQFVRNWCRGHTGNSLSPFPDRNHSFDILLREMSTRFEAPTVVETGTIRSEEDWGGAGFFSYWMGAYLFHRGGKLHSADITPAYCEFAREWTRVFGETVTVHQEDSIEFLRRFPESIDVLYLDSMDTTEPGHAEHALKEAKAALPKLHDRSLIVFDDTPWNAGAWVGKGATAVPWLIQQGWKVGYASYQVVLWKE